MANDGGSAFPYTNCEDHGISGGYGMTLRDYFAAKALQSLLLDSRYGGIVGVNCYEQYRAAEAYRIADAMLAERDK